METATIHEDLPEYQNFSILRREEKEAIGPFSQNQIVELLYEGAVRADDLVYYTDSGKWQPLHQVFERGAFRGDQPRNGRPGSGVLHRRPRESGVESESP